MPILNLDPFQEGEPNVFTKREEELIEVMRQVMKITPSNPKPRKGNHSYPQRMPSFTRPESEGTTTINFRQSLKLEKRAFTDLGIPLGVVYKEAWKVGLIRPLEPRAPPKPLPKGYNINEYCDYHQGLGHKTDQCKNLRHRVQDLIDGKFIIPPKAR